MEALLERLDEIEDDLTSRAFLYDSPVVYREAVEMALIAVRALVEREAATSAA